MSFAPTIPMGGIAGWRFLERTAEAQKETFLKGPALQREIAYFKEKIGEVKTAEALVKDRRLLQVALGAFGLEGEVDKKAFIRKILESDTADGSSMANRLSERGFRKMAAAFGFGDAAGAQTAKEGFADKIVAAYEDRQFEVAVGNANNSMRLAMNFRREIKEIAASGSDGSAWFSILGSRPLREVVETALGLPKEFAKIDVDRQREMIRGRMQSAFGDGSVAFFKDEANVEKVVTRYLARAQIAESSAGGVSSPALALLRGAANDGGAGLFSLIASRR